MENNWKDKWLENYQGKGDCAELEKRVVEFDYGHKKGVVYLPWAVVERIFRFQDGKTEFVRNEDGSLIYLDRKHISDEVDDDTGVITPRFINSYFINIKVEWQGQTYIEEYPLLDNNGKSMMFWSQKDINNAKQRGKVKAIAFVSGIGYKLFEDGDLQFDTNEDSDKPTVAKAKAKLEQTKTKDTDGSKPDLDEDDIEVEVQVKKAKPKAKVKAEPTIVKVDEPIVAPIVAPIVVEKEEEVVITDDTEIPLSRKELENEIKHQFLSGGSVKAAKIKSFLAEENIKKITDLSEDKVKELYKAVK